jgi:hypothetical protein
MHRWLAGLGLSLLAALGAASCGGSSGDSSDLVAACQKYCTAQAAPMCKKGLAEETCKSQCAAAPSALGGVCLAENTAALECVSGLTFTCLMDFPVPMATGCFAEAQALSTCQQSAPCQSFCKAAVAAGCGGASESACEDACKTEVDKQTMCSFELRDVKTCEGQQTLTCRSGTPVTTLCNSQKQQLASCLSFDDPCAGFCYLADDAGCAGGTMGACIMACQTQMGSVAACQFDDQSYLRCTTEHSVTCSGTMPTVPECTTEKQSYDMCVKNGM